MPNDENYDIYRNIDLTAEGKSYNSTLWRKDYNENDKTVNGLSYTLIASMTGNTPKFSVHRPITVLNADQDPDVTLDVDNIDTPVLHFYLPQSQILSMKDTIVLDANREPQVEYDDQNINNPTVQFSLPQSQVIEEAQIEELLDAGSDPIVRLDISGGDGINHPILKFSLPKGQALIPDNVTSQEINANQLPYITFDDTDKNRPSLKFFLPQAQVMIDPGLTVVGPSEAPDVDLDHESGPNSPKLNFKLPRAVKFYYGALLGERRNYDDEINEAFQGYGIGDYYINAASGFVYIVTKVDETTVSFEYVACIQSPLPTIRTTPISPYTIDKQQNNPQVIRTFTNDQQTAWQLEFQLPRIPKPQISHHYIPSTQEGSASVEITDQDTIQFSFEIPRGAKILAGTDLSGDSSSTVVDGAEAGDMYVNSDTGNIYILQDNGTWEKKPDNIQGPVGDALNIVYSYEIMVDESHPDNLETGYKEIEEKYKDPITQDMIFAVTFITDVSQISYWYFKQKNNEWSRIQLTGGIQSLLENEYNNEETGEVNNKTYTVHYINSLIDDKQGEKSRTTYSKQYIEELLSWGELE